jgi:hypothetical protein
MDGNKFKGITANSHIQAYTHTRTHAQTQKQKQQQQDFPL